MIRAALLGAVLVIASPALAAPVTLQCDYRGVGVNLGPLVLTVDETARRVVVTTRYGLTTTYQDGITARIFPPEIEDERGAVAQFVRFKPDIVEIGFRWPDDGALGHWAYFNRSALAKKSGRCLWRSFWSFGLA